VSFSKQKYMTLFEENPSGIFIVDCKWGRWALGEFGRLVEIVQKGATEDEL